MKYFVDTSFWCALYDSRDINHQKAKKLWEKAALKPLKIFISEYIFDETVTLVRRRISHYNAVELGESLLNSKIVVLLELHKEIREKAWKIFKKFSDKEFSFTDCSSFALMESYGLKKALSFDRHFEQMGFIVNTM